MLININTRKILAFAFVEDKFKNGTNYFFFIAIAILEDSLFLMLDFKNSQLY